MSSAGGFFRSAKSRMSAATMDGAMIFANETMVQALGYAKDEILRMRIGDFHPSEVARKYAEGYSPTR